MKLTIEQEQSALTAALAKAAATSVPMNIVALDAGGHMQALRGMDGALLASLESDLPQVPADRIQMQRVLAKLARNGIEAMEAVEGWPKCMKICSRVRGDEIVMHGAAFGFALRIGKET